MAILGQLKKELTQMKDTLQRLQMYRADVIMATDTRLEVLIAQTNLNEKIKRKLGEARNSLDNAKANGARLHGAEDRGTVLNLVLNHCKAAAESLRQAADLM